MIVRISADVPAVFALLRDMERWPSIFDHMQSARVVKRDRAGGSRRLIVVRATWYGLPVGWRAIQTIEPEINRMTLYHVSPLTRGSVATWEVRPVESSPAGRSVVELVVRQQVTVPLPLVGPLLARYFVGGTVG